MKILVISGFLGAGKTTFIRELVRRNAGEIAVFENEYGSVGVDGDVLKNSAETGQVNIWEMAEGCICCSMKGDFTASVLTIANTVDSDYLVIEPTGVGMLSNVIESLNRITYERIQILKPLTLVDGLSFQRYRAKYTELYLDQIRNASYLAITKMEQASAEEVRHLIGELRKINPSAEICPTHYKDADDAWWEQLLRSAADVGEPKSELRSATPQTETQLPDTFSMEKAYVGAPEPFLLFLEALIRGRYGNIIRAKGLIPAGACALRFDVADGRYSVRLEDPDSAVQETDQNAVAVFIGHGIAKQAIRRVIHQKNIAQRGKIRFTAAVNQR